jgi:hypothetical protein
MYHNDHAPAHFHAVYGDHEITMEIESGAFKGEFPNRALKHVSEWRELNRGALLENWTRARARRPLLKIQPLE